MPSELKTTIEILREKKGPVKMVHLSWELASRGALGFGVRVEDVVAALDRKVSYNSQDDTVTLKEIGDEQH